jgi:DNA-binding GntR family transcriptional regulator
MEKSLVIQGRPIGPAELEQVRGLLAAHPEGSRYRLSRELCRVWNWRSLTGQIKDMAARSLLLKLEQRGLVERIPNRGAVVTRLDLSQVAALYDVREVLEGLCARLATANGPRERWQRSLHYFRGPMARFVAAGDFDAYIAGYEAFRREAIEAAGNPVLAEMLDSIVERTQALIRRIIILPGRAEMGLRMHTAVIEAMCRGDADEAERLRRETLRSAKSFIDRYQKYIL